MTRVEIMLQVIRVIEYCFVLIFIFSIIIILGFFRFSPPEILKVYNLVFLKSLF
jgi:hypothetical protein